jgi:propanol-preferring alcohol dehydrogenase
VLRARHALNAHDLAGGSQELTMQAMVLKPLGAGLEWTELADRVPGPGELRVKVGACGVCRADLHLVDGGAHRPEWPTIPGHEIVGRIDALGPGVEGLRLGQRVGLPWLGHALGACPCCVGGLESLSAQSRFTGYRRDGGFASHTIAEARYAFPLGEDGSDVALAPLLSAGLVGWRSLGLAGPGTRLGLYGFGNSAQIVTQVAAWQGRSVYAFTPSGDQLGQARALDLGATWAGSVEEPPPQLLDAAIIFATLGEWVPLALKAVRRGGRVICAGMSMSAIPRLPYRLLWGERQLISVAGLSRQDGIDFLRLAPQIGIAARTTRYPLQRGNQALADLRAGRCQGAAVLVP